MTINDKLNGAKIPDKYLNNYNMLGYEFQTPFILDYYSLTSDYGIEHVHKCLDNRLVYLTWDTNNSRIPEWVLNDD